MLVTSSVPQGKAVPATKKNVEYFEARRAELEAKLADVLAAANARAEKINAPKPLLSRLKQATKVNCSVPSVLATSLTL